MGTVQLEASEQYPAEAPTAHPAQAPVEAEDLLALEEPQLELASAEGLLAPEELQLEHVPRSLSPCGGRSAA